MDNRFTEPKINQSLVITTRDDDDKVFQLSILAQKSPAGNKMFDICLFEDDSAEAIFHFGFIFGWENAQSFVPQGINITNIEILP